MVARPRRVGERSKVFRSGQELPFQRFAHFSVAIVDPARNALAQLRHLRLETKS